MVESSLIGWGALALFLFVAGFIWTVARRIPEVDEHVRIQGGHRFLEYRCDVCKHTSVLQLPAPLDYTAKFDSAFRLLHQRCEK